MTTSRWLVVAATLGLVGLAAAATRLVTGADKPGHTASMLNLIVDGLIVLFVALIVIFYVGVA